MTGKDVSRRGLLGALGVGAAGVAAVSVGAVAGARGDTGGPRRSEPVVPFHGPHQAGVATSVQAHLHFAAFDVTASDVDGLRSLLQDWTVAARELTAGRPVGDGAVGGSPLAPPDDTGEALDVTAHRLTLTVGFGASLFDDRFGLASRRPEALVDLPHFPGDVIDPVRSDGDLVVQACADDPQVAVHAIRNLSRIAAGRAAIRWAQLGYGKAASTDRSQPTPRNLFGFKDGTANPSGADTATLDEHVWVAEDDAASPDEAWMAGGSYLVARRISMLIETWDRTPLGEQETLVGRDKGEGAPLGRRKEFDPVRAEGPAGVLARAAGAPVAARWGADAAPRLQLRRRRRLARTPRRRPVLPGLPARPAHGVHPRADAAGPPGRPDGVPQAHRLRPVRGPARGRGTGLLGRGVAGGVTTRPGEARISTARRVQATYLGLTLLTTLSASLIWGINTLFLLDAGLSNLEAFAANAFFTAGMMLFEIPTGVVADLRGRRLSFLLGALTLAATTGVYVLLWWVEAPFWAWAISSVGIGLGFTFFSGAVEAWLVDALTATGYAGDLTTVFGRGQAVTGAAMLGGSVLGGVIAQATNLGVPFVVRVGLLLVTVVVAAIFMHDLGFTPDRTAKTLPAMRGLLDASVEHGLRNRPVRWLMLTSPFVGGVGVYAFYALQPYLLELYGDPTAYGFAGLAAAAVAGAQILGGVLAPRVRRLVPRPTTVLLVGTAVAAASLVVVGLVPNLVLVLVSMVVWALTGATVLPVRQAYLNGMIPSQQRATVLSFDSLLSSSGGVVVQPVMGRVGDVSGYPLTFVLSGAVQALALPFYWMARREQPGREPVAAPEAADA